MRTRFPPNAHAAAPHKAHTRKGYLSLGWRTSVGAASTWPITTKHKGTFLPQISRVKIDDLSDRQTD
jgi:hypothetical protein